MEKPKYFLVNKNYGLIGGCDYGSEEAAKAAIPNCNIPDKDAEVFVLPPWFDNKIDHSKCTPLKFDKNINKTNIL